MKLPIQAVTIDGEPIAIKKIHPTADLFPFIEGDDFDDLVRSLSEQGQHTPVVVSDGVLLDGRNRLRACQAAGLKPLAAIYAGTDPDAFALSVNIDRRHLSKGQRAMIAAKACLETKQTVRDLAARTGMNVGRIGQASTVIQHAPEMVDAVISGATSLDEAYAEARARKQAQADSESVSKQAIAKLHKLADVAPDLAEQVSEERMSLREAEAAYKERAEERRERAIKWASDDSLACTTFEKYAHEIPLETMRELWPIAAERFPDLPQRLRAAAQAATQLANELENI
jgi:ParB-like chromosome segregation protein Spo0J